MSSLAKENSHASQKQKVKKDILHRIGKVQENKILGSKDHNVQDFEIQKNCQKKLDFQIDFQEKIQDDQNDNYFYIAENSEIKNEELIEKLLQMGIFCFKEDSDGDKGEVEEKETINKSEQVKKQKVDKIDQKTEQKGKQKLQLDLNQKCDQKNVRVNRKLVKEKKQRKNIDFEECSEYEESSDSSEDQPIRGITITSNPLQGNVTINIINKKELVDSPLPPGIVLKCIIRRSPTFLNPQFDIYLHNGLKHLIAAKKYSLAKNDVFKFYSELGKYEQKFQTGTIIANTVHSLYWFTTPTPDLDAEIKSLISYQKMVKNTERKMKVHLCHKQKIYAEYKRLCYEGQSYLKTANPLTLRNMNWQEKQNSIKNFVLIDEDDKQYQYLKMVKTSENMFELLIQHPLSPMQAFAIALTRFDAQLK